MLMVIPIRLIGFAQGDGQMSVVCQNNGFNNVPSCCFSYSLQDGYYGLSEEAYGCKYCNCDPGGSYNNSCNRDSGQCYCRPHITGRQCNQVASGYFYTYMDYFMYEAELSRVLTPTVSRSVSLC